MKMRKLFIIILILCPLTVHATKMTDFTEDTSPTSDDIFWTTNDPSGSPADRKVSLGNLLLWMATQTVSVGGTWTMTTPVLDTPTITLADASTLTLPAAAVDSGWTTGLLGFGPDGTGIFVNIADLEATIPISGEITDEQVACWESSETPGTNKLKSCGAKTTDNSTASNFIYKDSDGHLENATTTGTGTTMVLATSPTLVTPLLGTPTSGTLTNCTGLPASALVASTSQAVGFGSIELGHASDTSITKASAGVIAVEGLSLPRIVASGTSELGTAEIAAGNHATVVTTTATGTATTDVIIWGFNSDPHGITGYAPSTNGGLFIYAYPSSNNVNFLVVNNTSAAITPGSAITLNWKVLR